jgi:hypothetical protein
LVQFKQILYQFLVKDAKGQKIRTCSGANFLTR